MIVAVCGHFYQYSAQLISCSGLRIKSNLLPHQKSSAIDRVHIIAIRTGFQALLKTAKVVISLSWLFAASYKGLFFLLQWTHSLYYHKRINSCNQCFRK